MPLVTCPDCRNQISDAALLCVYCGRVELLSRSHRKLSQYACPECGSHDLQPFSWVYDCEVKRQREGKLVTFHFQRTALAKAVASPVSRSVSRSGIILVGAFFGVFAGLGVAESAYPTIEGSSEMTFLSLVGIWLIVALSVGFGLSKFLYEALYKNAQRYNDTVYRPRKAIYDRSLMCLECGAMLRPRE